MKIAFVGAPELHKLFNEHLSIIPTEEVNPTILADFDRFIFQIDLTPLPNGYYPPFGAATWLTQLLKEEKLQSKPILLTAWQPPVPSAPNITNFDNSINLAQLLKSPLIKLYPLKFIYDHRHQLDRLFDPPLNDTQDDDLLRQDIRHNLFLPAVIHEFFHQLKERVRSAANFSPSSILKELRHFLFSHDNAAYGLSNEVERQLENVLPEKKDRDSFIFYLEKLEQLLKDTIEANEATPDEGELTVVYIDDNPKHTHKLKQLLGKFQITCYGAGNEKEAFQVLKMHKNICAVLCDFRFYDNDQRLSRKQGYHILYHLSLEFPQLKYAFLSDRIGLTNALPLDLRWQWPEFKKIDVLDERPSEKKAPADQAKISRTGLPALLTFLDLAERARKNRNTPLPRELKKNLSIWGYETEKNWIEASEMQRELGIEALNLLRSFPSVSMLPKEFKGINTKSRPKRVGKSKRQFLFNRILLRRLTLGFLQMPIERLESFAERMDLEDLDFEFRNRWKWGVIYFYLTHGNARKLKSPTIAKAFNKLGFQTTKDYNFRHKIVRKHILPSEWKWLQDHGYELAQLNKK